MKVQSMLLVAQTVMILFLLGKMSGIDEQVRNFSVTERTPPFEVREPFRAASDCVPDASPTLSEDQLREIVASELSRQIGALQPVHSRQYESADAPGLSPAESQRQLERVAERIEYHTSVGAISPGDMLALQSEISKLDPAGRKQMLSELVQRMNSGQLEGQL